MRRFRLPILAVLSWSMIAWGWAIFRRDLLVGLPDAEGVSNASGWAAVSLVGWRIFGGLGLLLAGWLLYRSLRPTVLPRRAAASLCFGLACAATVAWGLRIGDRVRFRSLTSEINYLEQLLQTRWANRAIHEDVDDVQIERVIAELRRRASSGGRDAYGVALRDALWQMGDGHLTVAMPDAVSYLSDLAFVAVAEGLALTWAGPAYEGVGPGDRLIEIEGQDPEAFLADRRFYPGSTIGQRRHLALSTLSYLLLLPGEAATPSQVVLETLAGERRRVEVTWRTFSDTTSTSRDAALPRCVNAKRSDDRIGYIQFVTFFCADADGQQSNDRFLQELVAAGRTLRGVRDLIVDLRVNGGGSDEQGRMAAALLVRGGMGWYRAGLRLAPVRYRADDEVRVDPAEWPAIDPLDARLWVLIGPGCFSTCDIFAGALRARVGATFVGRATGGGAGHPFRFRLPRSGFIVQIPSLEVYFPDGRLVETHPIEPDVAVVQTAVDLRAERDTVLEHTRQLIHTAR